MDLLPVGTAGNPSGSSGSFIGGLPVFSASAFINTGDLIGDPDPGSTVISNIQIFSLPINMPINFVLRSQCLIRCL